MSSQIVQMVLGLGAGLGLALFHRPIADFMLQQERALANVFYAKGLPVLPVATQRQLRNVYFVVGILVAVIEAARLWLMTR